MNSGLVKLSESGLKANRWVLVMASALIGISSLVGCASHGDSSAPPKATTDEDIMGTIEEIPAGADATGVLTFFSGDDRGVVIKSIKWNKGLSSENPGTDCELKFSTDNSFECTETKGPDTITLTVKETSGGSDHKLYRISLHGSGSVARDRWINQLSINGFARQGQRSKEGSMRYYYSSGARGSRAELVWVPKTEDVLVTLGPPPTK